MKNWLLQPLRTLTIWNRPFPSQVHGNKMKTRHLQPLRTPLVSLYLLNCMSYDAYWNNDGWQIDGDGNSVIVDYFLWCQTSSCLLRCRCDTQRGFVVIRHPNRGNQDYINEIKTQTRRVDTPKTRNVRLFSPNSIIVCMFVQWCFSIFKKKIEIMRFQKSQKYNKIFKKWIRSWEKAEVNGWSQKFILLSILRILVWIFLDSIR